MEVKSAYSTKETAVLLGITRQAVDLRAQREGWDFQTRPGHGGGKLWLVASMPLETRQALAAALASQHATSPANAERESTLQLSLAELATLSDTRRTRAEARATLAHMAKSFIAALGLKSESAGLRQFCELYNTHSDQIAVAAHVREAVPHVCINSVKSWIKALADTGISTLAGKYGHRAGSGLIDSQPALLEIALAWINDHPDASAAMLYAALRTRIRQAMDKGGPDFIAPVLPSQRRCQDWLRRWKGENKQLFSYIAAPDQWRSRFMSACGDKAQHITRPNQRWEFDGTPSDLLLTDGHRYCITGVIDVFTRRAKMLVTPRASAHAVASLTRRAILDWGLPETPVTDNGKDYVAQHMMQLWRGLEIDPLVLPPFRPDLKPFIERLYRSFSHSVLTLLPGYTGHNVAARQRIRERTTFAKRFMTQGEEIEFNLTHAELQTFCDDWCNAFHAHQPHSGLKGRTPFEVAAQVPETAVRRIMDERALDILLLPMAPGTQGWRVVGKGPVRAGGRKFEAHELGGIEGQMVQVRLDATDAGVAYLFDENGDFVCRAVDHDLLGLQLEEVAAHRRNKQAAAMREGSKLLKEASKKANLRNIGQEIMQERVASAAKKATMPHPSTEYTTNALQQASRAAMSRQGMPAITAERAAQLTAEAKTALTAWHCPDNSVARYQLCKNIMDRVAQGAEVLPEERNWMNNYRHSTEFSGHEAMNRLFFPENQEIQAIQ